jgi:hypothetical protein
MKRIYQPLDFGCLLLWVASLGLVAPVSAQGNSGNSGKGVQLVQRIDDVLYGVDPLSLTIVDNRHVTGVFVRVSVDVHQAPPSPSQVNSQEYSQGYSHFLTDCQSPMRFAVLSTAASPLELTPQGATSRARYEAAKAVLASARLTQVSMLDASRSVAEFACNATQRPARAAHIAKELFEQGGPTDMRTALCDLQPDGARVTREDVAVRFSDSEKVVAVNNQWMTSGLVTDTEISFGRGGARWRIDRNTAEASLLGPAGQVIFVGSCVAGDKTPPSR